MKWIFCLVFFAAFPLFAEVYSIEGTADGAVWIGTSEGLFKCAENKIHPIHSGSFFSLQPIQNEIWAATDQGLLRCKDFECAPDSRWTKGEIRFVAANPTHLWVASVSQLFEITNQAVTPVKIPATTINVLDTNSAGELWIGTREFVARIRKGIFESVMNNSAQGLIAEPEVWIGTGFEIIHWNNGKTETLELPPPPANVRMLPPIKTILVNHGALWVGTRVGLFQRNGSRLQKIFSDVDVSALFQDKKSVLWIGSEDGLKQYRNGKLSEVGLPTARRN